MTKGYAVIEFLKKKYPSIKLLEVDGIDQGIQLLRDKRVYGYIDSLVTIGYYVSKQGALDIKVNGDLNFKAKLSIATTKDQPQLHTVMQKLLDSISDKEIEEIKNKWIHVQYEKVQDNRKLFMGLFISIALFIIALIAILKLFKGDLEYIRNSKDPFQFRKELFLHHIIFSIIVSVTVAPIFYMIDLDMLAVILNLFTFTAISLLVLLRKSDLFSSISRVFIVAIMILFSSGLYCANQEINILFFLLIFPIFAFSVRGIKEGFFWVFLFLSIILVGYVYKLDDYNPISFLFFVIAYIMITYHYYNYRFYEIKFFEQHHEIQEKKDQLLLQQTKYANMGEMLGTIIHQWRQPLSEISSNIMRIEVENEYKEKVDKGVVKESVEDINTLLLLMSKTLDSFQLVYKKDENMEEFFFPGAIEDTIAVFKSVVKSIDITLKYDKQKEKHLYINGIKEDLFNIFLILVKNSQDAFLSHNIKNKMIEIELDFDERNIYVSYMDNAGGISLKPVEKVFEQNSSSKKSGMGIGLYIVKKLITQRYDGKIEVQNINGGVLFKFSFHKNLQ